MHDAQSDTNANFSGQSYLINLDRPCSRLFRLILQDTDDCGRDFMPASAIFSLVVEPPDVPCCAASAMLRYLYILPPKRRLPCILCTRIPAIHHFPAFISCTCLM
jgi:hypothetical protein